MKIPEEIILVSKASILSKQFNITEEQLREKFSGAELEQALAFLPSEDEKKWMEIFQSKIPQLARLQRKMSVCVDAEVTEINEDSVSYEYGENSFRIESPKNAFRICTALDKSTLDGISEMAFQKCIKKNGEIISDIKRDGVLSVDELQLLTKISSKFFFQTFLE